MTADVLREAGDRLTTMQGYVLKRTYQSRTGDLAANLASKPYHVYSGADGVSMQVDYLPHIRLLDLKKTRYGKLKKRYEPIYNKYVWGFLMGFVYGRLRSGLTRQVLDRGLSTTVININL